MSIRSKEVTKKKFLVVGTPCGGVNYVGNMLSLFGFQVGTEKRMLRDGLAYWKAASPIFRKKYNNFGHIIHVVRNPWEDIAETGVLLPKTDFTDYKERAKKICPEIYKSRNRFERAAWAYVAWHELLLSQISNFVVLLETCPNSLVTYLKANDLLNDWAENGAALLKPPNGYVWKRTQPDVKDLPISSGEVKSLLSKSVIRRVRKLYVNIQTNKVTNMSTFRRIK